MTKIKLKIADIIIQFKSKFPMEPFKKSQSCRCAHFIYKGPKGADISLEVRLVKKLPNLDGLKRLFLTRHPESKQDNWAIFERERGYILREYLQPKAQHIVLSRDFNRGIVYFYPGADKKLEWTVPSLIYDALQIILIHYLTRHDGIFLHASGLWDIDGRGLLFVGKSGAGKSTIVRLWDRYSRAQILNDDRMIVRKIKGNFYIYGTPWHGDFNDYLFSRRDSVRLTKMFFIFHRNSNKFQSLLRSRVLRNIYPNIFFPFWDKDGLDKSLVFSEALAESVPAYRLGFKDSKEIIGFIRAIE